MELSLLLIGEWAIYGDVVAAEVEQEVGARTGTGGIAEEETIVLS